jgi:hypothetical protein
MTLAMTPARDLLYQRLRDEFLPEEEGEDFSGEQPGDQAILELREMMKRASLILSSLTHYSVNAKLIHLTLYFLIVFFSIAKHRF